MRIGTWNLDGRRSDRHAHLLHSVDCDVWLLTEVHPAVTLLGYAAHLTHGEIRPGVRWAGVFCRSSPEPLADPHPASAMARIDGTTFVSSVFPWRSSGGAPPWVGASQGERTRQAVADLRGAVGNAAQLVWGGDWNHELAGHSYAGSRKGRDALLAALAAWDLSAPTRDLRAARGGPSVNHLAVLADWSVTSAMRVPATDGADRLSDHDLYTLDVNRPRRSGAVVASDVSPVRAPRR